MKSIFNSITRDEIVQRINSLNESNTAQWGKMNVYQMVRHCVLCEEMYLGKTKYKRAFIGRLFGKMGLKNLLKDDMPLKHNSPTSAAFKITQVSGNVNAEKENWIALIKEYEHYSNEPFIHWFFGKMTQEEIGYFVYKHSDHHLRQFNC